MSKQKFKPTLLFIIAITIALIISSYMYIKKTPTYTNEFINVIKNNREYSLDETELDLYKTKIQQKLNNDCSNNTYKKAYCCLGYIEFIDGNYTESNDYLLKALEYNPFDKSEIQVLIYNAISKNYLALKDVVKSSNYFKKAEDIALEKNYCNLLSKMYRSRASSLLGFKNGMTEAIDLTEKAIDLDKNEKNKTENYLLLSKLYMLSDMFELSLDYNLKALKL